jgi:ribosomal protein S18 acetylase RimI-like enzyme
MEAQITKRNATAEDTDFARDIHHKAYHDVIIRQFGSWDETMQDNFFKKGWRPETHEIILSGDSSCGYCSIEYNSEQIYLHELVLSPDFQGKGIGSKILKELIEESKQKNIPIRLQVLKENQAQHLYRKLGFNDKKKTDTHFEMEFDPS